MKISLIPQVGHETVHCSQGDTNRQWQFDIYGDKKIDIVDSPNPTYWIDKGGTEEILPTNTSVPTTSPIKCDIQYTDGLRTDQEFTYRESPTTEDGSAKLKSIYGNTLVWNQQVPNGNFVDTSLWDIRRGSASVSSNVLTYTITQIGSTYAENRIAQNIAMPSGHKIFVSADIKPKYNNQISFNFVGSNRIDFPNITANAWNSLKKIFTNNANSTSLYLSFNCLTNYVVGDIIEVRNVILVDLTQMGLDIADPSEFTSLFPLPYYTYDTGSLVSFNGNGLKTVGFNQWDEEWEVGNIDSSNGNNVGSTTLIRSKNYISVFPNTLYYFRVGSEQGSTNNIRARFYDAEKNYIGSGDGTWRYNSTYTIPYNAHYMRFVMQTGYGTTYKNDICINISSSRNGDYEPYTSSTLDIPTSTYFPNGMKSVGSVYDELSNNKAVTRVGGFVIDGNSVRSFATTSTGIPYVRGTKPSNTIPDSLNIKTIKYQPTNTAPSSSNFIRFLSTDFLLYDSAFTDLATAQSILNANPVTVYYELATPTETNITSATMVTEYGESDLDSNGVVICNEGMSKYSGFHDAKIRVSDGDGDVYSAKFQVHVERKPK